MAQRAKMEESKIKPCPHCSGPLPKVKTEMDLGYGQALCTCPHCGGTYADSTIREIAVRGVSFWDRMPIRLMSLVSFLVGVGLFGGEIWMVTSSGFYHPMGFVFGALAVIIGIVLGFGDIKTYGKRLKYLKQEQLASEQRMQDAAYAQQLKDLHYGEKTSNKK